MADTTANDTELADFRPRNHNELTQLDDDGLIAYAVEARMAGDHDAVKPALAIVVNRRLPDMVRRCRLKMSETDAEDVAMNAVEGALKAAFEGSSVGEFVNLLNRIVSRRIADFHRSKDPDADLYVESGSADEDDVWVTPGGTPDATGEVDVRSVVDQAYEELSEPHAMVIDLYVFDDLQAQDAANSVNDAFPDLDPPMSDQNVQQVASRFRKGLRTLFEEAKDPSSESPER